MQRSNSSGKKGPFILWLLSGIPALFVIASPLHFLYGWTGSNIIAGLFVPVNESPWEHLKLAFWPIVLWWIIGYIAFARKDKGGFPRAAVACAVCTTVCLLAIIAFFYTYTGALGTESLILDILSLLLGLAFGVLLAVHVTRHTSPGALAALISVLILLLMAGLFIRFTVAPPRLPLFRDPPTGSFGIYKLRG